MAGLFRTAAWLSALAFVAMVSAPVSAQEVLKAAGGAGPGAPYHIVDPDTKAQSGIMVELLNAIGKDAGFTVEYVEPIPVADLISSVVDGKIDVIANNLGITPERQKLIDFSIPFFNAGETLLVLATDTTDYQTLLHLKGAKVGAVKGSLYEPALVAMGDTLDEVKTYATTAEVADAVLKGEVTAGVLSSVPVEYALSQGKYAGLKTVPTYQQTLTSQLGLAIAKGRPELLKRIDDSLTKLIADGTVAKIFAANGIKWMAP
jgi:polar amino acid transport system substrate-binding protein